MDPRLQKLKLAREKSRERQIAFSLLGLLLASLRRFIDFQGTLMELLQAAEETAELLESILEELEAQQECEPGLSELLENVLEFIEASFDSEEISEADATMTLISLRTISPE